MSTQTVKSGELFSFVTSGSRGWAKYYSQTGPVFLRVGNLDHDSISLDLREIQRVQPPQGGEGTRTRVHTNDILISVTADVGMVGLVPEGFEEGYINQHVALARPIPKVHAPYLAWCLSSPASQKQFKELQRGATKVGLGLDDIRAIDVHLPPLPEQRRIVAEIEKQFTRLEAGVAALRRVQANLKRSRAAVLKAACEGRLVPTEAELAKTGNRKAKFETGEALLARILTERRQNWQSRGQYKEPVAPDTRNVALVTEGWTWASVDQLADETMIGLDRGRAQQSDDPAAGVPYIKMTNVTMDGRVLCDDLVHVPASREEATRFAVQDGDILFNTRNSKELVGKVGLVRNPPAGAIYNNNLMRIRVPAGVSQAFLALQMCSHEFRQRMELVKKATTSVAAVYSKDLLPLAIALPPLAEQTRIVVEIERRLSVVEELEAVVSANLQRAIRLRQSILQKAFTGGLV